MGYIFKTDLTFTLVYTPDADEHQHVLELRYTVYPGCAATLEQPGERPSASIYSATIISGDRRYDAPAWLWPAIEGDEELARELLANAAEADSANADSRADATREERQLSA